MKEFPLVKLAVKCVDKLHFVLLGLSGKIFTECAAKKILKNQEALIHLGSDKKFTCYKIRQHLKEKNFNNNDRLMSINNNLGNIFSIQKSINYNKGNILHNIFGRQAIKKLKKFNLFDRLLNVNITDISLEETKQILEEYFALEYPNVEVHSFLHKQYLNNNESKSDYLVKFEIILKPDISTLDAHASSIRLVYKYINNKLKTIFLLRTNFFQPINYKASLEELAQGSLQDLMRRNFDYYYKWDWSRNMFISPILFALTFDFYLKIRKNKSLEIVRKFVTRKILPELQKRNNDEAKAVANLYTNKYTYIGRRDYSKTAQFVKPLLNYLNTIYGNKNQVDELVCLLEKSTAGLYGANYSLLDRFFFEYAKQFSGQLWADRYLNYDKYNKENLDFCHKLNDDESFEDELSYIYKGMSVICNEVKSIKNRKVPISYKLLYLTPRFVKTNPSDPEVVSPIDIKFDLIVKFEENNFGESTLFKNKVAFYGQLLKVFKKFAYLQHGIANYKIMNRFKDECIKRFKVFYKNLLEKYKKL